MDTFENVITKNVTTPYWLIWALKDIIKTRRIKAQTKPGKPLGRWSGAP